MQRNNRLSDIADLIHQNWLNDFYGEKENARSKKLLTRILSMSDYAESRGAYTCAILLEDLSLSLDALAESKEPNLYYGAVCDVFTSALPEFYQLLEKNDQTSLFALAEAIYEAHRMLKYPTIFTLDATTRMLNAANELPQKEQVWKSRLGKTLLALAGLAIGAALFATPIGLGALAVGVGIGFLLKGINLIEDANKSRQPSTVVKNLRHLGMFKIQQGFREATVPVEASDIGMP